MSIDREVAAIETGEHGDPFAFLGPHELGGGRVVVRSFQPGAQRVALIDAAGATVDARSCDGQGMFEAICEHGLKRPYRLRVAFPGGEREIADPYQFGPWLGETDTYLLREGTHLTAFDRLGAHFTAIEGIEGVSFAVWAPNALRVSVVGDFNNWDGRRHPMRLHPGAGIWELFIPGLGEGDRYKYEIKPHGGDLPLLKADPYAFAAERPPNTASVICRTDRHQWQDQAWIEERQRRDLYPRPMNIYEVHLGSWRRRPEDGHRWLSYREFAETLVPYAKDMGFTHIELLPITEFPFDGSWGYQPTSLFAPTSRFGTPTDFQFFVDACHRAGLGVILDWVPGHFPNDPHGLAEFDGSKLYEHADPRQGLHKDWNTLIYNYGRAEVAEFLLSSALFWLDRYHIDGLRVDAVASMLYLDYSRKPGEWVPNRFGGRENLEAIDFLKRMNEHAYGGCPGITTAAEESTAWPGVSRPTYDGGLGFGYKWNMGWMHDTLEYIHENPVHRRWHHEKLTFGLVYAFSENFILPLSHDEVVHGKGSLLGKMPGDRWQRFANLRAYLGFMWAHPGKKLLFMGGEFAQDREWNHDHSLDWHLLEQSEHRGVQNLVRDLNRAYRDAPALHRRDCEAAGFEWVEMNDHEHSVLAFLRHGFENDPPIIAVCNFTPEPRPGYRVGVPRDGFWRERIHTDASDYGGSGMGNLGGVHAEEIARHGRAHSLSLTLPPLATVIFEFARDP